MARQIENYNWSEHEARNKTERPNVQRVEIDDETWRDGLQGTQLRKHPSVQSKIDYLHAASSLGIIDHADIGFPASGEKHRKDIGKIIDHVKSEGLPLTLSTAGRGSARDDVLAIANIAKLHDYPLEADLFLDASLYRAEIEKWNRTEKLDALKGNIELLKERDLPVMFVPERATSTHPEQLLEIINLALDAGADRICIADTQGRANARAIRNIFREVRQFKTEYPKVKWDFHGHNDLGLGVSNCMVAVEEGVERVHTTAFGIGERTGNVEHTSLLMNLNIEGYRKDDLTTLQEFAGLASRILKYTIPSHMPIIGESALDTSSGVHGSAYVKEQKANDTQKNDSLPPIYFAYNPEDVGRTPTLRVGPFSGVANVYGYAHQLGLGEVTEETARHVLDMAKRRMGLLSAEDFKKLVRPGNGSEY